MLVFSEAETEVVCSRLAYLIRCFLLIMFTWLTWKCQKELFFVKICWGYKKIIVALKPDPANHRYQCFDGVVSQFGLRIKCQNVVFYTSVRQTWRQLTNLMVTFIERSKKEKYLELLFSGILSFSISFHIEKG